ncbi:hypothetical protein [Mycolicibacterium sp. J2]|uniref:hypothetical protein n=1 Tax=Mycolicibacterium sp. J2 TaxID=2993511 RepID=UPI00224AA2AB|nr:hypothetical protein [Mycolicibacterium sp. J2]MCX2714517.1 hypothetical protein [Mycolicibacterium sp. J2]
MGLDNRGVRTADVIVFVLLVCVQFAGVGIALLSVLVLPMSIDNCAYQGSTARIGDVLTCPIS